LVWGQSNPDHSIRSAPTTLLISSDALEIEPFSYSIQQPYSDLKFKPNLITDYSRQHTPIPADTISAHQERMLLDLLDTSLNSLADTERRGRKTGGYILLGLGTAMAIGGGVTLAVSDDKDTDIVGYSLLGTGAFMGGLSLLPFRIISQSERNYKEFKRMSAGSAEQMERKFRYWDRRFEEIAEQAYRDRMIGGATLLVASGITSWLIVEGSARDKLYTFVWPAIGGVTSLLVKTETERRYQTYRRAKKDLSAVSSAQPNLTAQWQLMLHSSNYPHIGIRLSW
jgi:hypothetical protein